MKTVTERYQDFIAKLPAPGGGGAHRAIYGAGCMGFRAGLRPEQIIADVAGHLPDGTRHVSRAEIEEGIHQAFADMAGGRAVKQRQAPRVAPDALERIICEGRGATESDIMARSPITLDWPDREASWRVLEVLYREDERIFIGDDKSPGILGQTIQPRAEWVRQLKRLGQSPWPKIMVNPLTGAPAPKKSGEGQTLRGDGCVAAHRLVVVEHDHLDLSSQLAFWRAAPLPVAALVHSGKKSIHAWLRVDCTNAQEWESEIEEKLFPQYLTPMGFDPACRNASRLSRMPGHVRADTGLVQQCIYLAPAGKAVNG